VFCADFENENSDDIGMTMSFKGQEALIKITDINAVKDRIRAIAEYNKTMACAKRKLLDSIGFLIQ
jgi:hypothetical protein